MKSNTYKNWYCVGILFGLMQQNMYADGPGTTTIFNPSLIDGIQGAQCCAYNSTDNQYLL